MDRRATACRWCQAARPAGMRLRHRILLWVVLGAGGALAAGFAGFLYMISLAPAPLPAHADGIVALTGGPGRVETALHLLLDGRADKLLITGIGGGTELATLGRITGLHLSGVASRITLGRYAASTRGNGVETAAWAHANRIATLIVVTANYHMPRAMAELRSSLPGVTLLPLPVQFADHRLLSFGPRLRLEAEEYAKYLFTISGLSTLLPPREGHAALLLHERAAG